MADQDEVVDQAGSTSAEEDTDGDEDDVEDTLDVIVSAWFHRSEFDEDNDDELEDGTDVNPDGLAEVVPSRRAGEFLCPSCFLLKHTSQLVDPAAGVCRDCA